MLALPEASIQAHAGAIGGALRRNYTLQGFHSHYHSHMSGLTQSIDGDIAYTSDAPGREGQERGRESFRMDLHRDGSRVITAHSEIDDPPPVVRDVSLRLDAANRPAECFVRIAVGGSFRGAGFFTFHDDGAEARALTALEGRFSQRMQSSEHPPGFGNHALVNDGYLLSLYDLSAGPGLQRIPGLLMSSPDHRGATGPMLFRVDVGIRFHGRDTVTVPAGNFDALHFSYESVAGLPVEHPAYDLWCTSDGHYVLLRGVVGGYMQTRYELARLRHRLDPAP